MSARELFMSYMRGWRDGAGTHAMRPEFVNHATRQDISAAYRDGYSDGRDGLGDAAARAMDRFGYTPTIVRASDLKVNP